MHGIFLYLFMVDSQLNILIEKHSKGENSALICPIFSQSLKLAIYGAFWGRSFFSKLFELTTSFDE